MLLGIITIEAHHKFHSTVLFHYKYIRNGYTVPRCASNSQNLVSKSTIHYVKFSILLMQASRIGVTNQESAGPKISRNPQFKIFLRSIQCRRSINDNSLLVTGVICYSNNMLKANVTSSAKTLHVRMQILTYFYNFKMP